MNNDRCASQLIIGTNDSLHAAPLEIARAEIEMDARTLDASHSAYIAVFAFSNVAPGGGSARMASS